MEDNLSAPLRRFTIAEWATLRANTPQPLTEAKLDTLRGQHGHVSLDEVAQVYLPLSRLLRFHVAAIQKLNVSIRHFMGVEQGTVPFIIGIAGSVAVGKSTVFNKPGAFFSHCASLDEQQAIETAGNIWDSINQVNLTENILPTKNRARLMLHKSTNHSIDQVQLRQM